MELFVVVHRTSLEVLKGFNNKMDAKRFRKEKNKVDGDGNEVFDHIISPCRDHDKTHNKSFTINEGKIK